MRAGVTLFSFAGWPAASLGGFFALVGLLTIGLYILKLRRRQLAVPFLDLWEKLLVERKASAWRTRLQRLLSLLLSLLLIGALVLALGDPRSDGEEEEARSIAIIVDISASMGEKIGERTRLDLARDKIRKWISSLGVGDEILLVAMGARSRPLDAFVGSKERLRELLNEVKVVDSSADLNAALSLCQDALRGRDHGEIILVSDGGLSPHEKFETTNLPPITFESVIDDSEVVQGNLAVTAFSARRIPIAPDRFEVLAEVANEGTESAEVSLSLYQARPDGSKGALLDFDRMDLGPGQHLSKIYENLAHAQEGLIAEIARVNGGKEALLSDNVARTLLSPRKTVRVLLVGEPNTFVEAALSVDESIEISSVSKEDYPPSGQYELTIFDGAFPVRSPQTGAALYLGVPKSGDAYPVEVGEQLSMFGFDTWEKESPLFHRIDPYNVQVLAGAELVGDHDDRDLAHSNGKSILVEGERDEGRFLALGFSPSQSDFVMRAVWPLFILNVVEELVSRDGGGVSLAMQTGQVWRVPVSVRANKVLVRGPYTFESAAVGRDLSGETIPVREVPISDGKAVFYGNKAGFYDLIAEGQSIRFAASMLGSAESKLVPTTELILGGRAIDTTVRMTTRSDRKPWVWLLFGVFCVSFVEWWMYHRRWTV